MALPPAPFPHQRAAIFGGSFPSRVDGHLINLASSRYERGYGAFWEPGLGKSRFALDTMRELAEAGRINGALILAPTGAHRNWSSSEIPTHLGIDEAETFLWLSDKAYNKSFQYDAEAFLKGNASFPILVQSYDSLMTDLGVRFVRRFLDKYDCLVVGDESQSIKTPGAKRTIRAKALSTRASYRRVLTGTLVDNSPFDVYPQLTFLNEAAFYDLGIRDAASFRNTFGVFLECTTTLPGGRRQDYNKLVTYKNLDLLRSIVLKHGTRLLKDDVLDLPPKLYTTRYYRLSPDQSRVYEELEKEYMTELNGVLLTAPLAIQRLTRLQQVTSGYLPDPAGQEDTPKVRIGDTQPRLAVLEDILDETAGTPKLIWAKYDEDISLIAGLLDRLGIGYARYDGSVSEAQRFKNKADFLEGRKEVFLSKESVGGVSLTLTRARVEVFYNTTFYFGRRRQAEDRAHRIGTMNPVLIYDIVAERTVDTKIVRDLQSKYEVAAFTMGDKVKEWLVR